MVKQVFFVLLVVIVGWLVYLQLRDDRRIINPIIQPVYVTPAPVQVIQIEQVVQYPTPVIQVIELPTVYIPEPTLAPFNRGGYVGAEPTGIVGSHNPGRTDKRSP